MNDESMWEAARKISAAANLASQAAYRMEEAVRRIAYLLEDGRGGNGVRLVELLEELLTSQRVIASSPAEVKEPDHDAE